MKDATNYATITITAQAVSIHASVKDATDMINVDVSILVVSIHASVKDATYTFGSWSAGSRFQSTRP